MPKLPEAVQRGRESVKKGTKFEEEVSEIYRLLGAYVTRNIEICHKKVDILATFHLPGSHQSHKIIIECKDEIKPRRHNQRVMELKGLLKIARDAGAADSAEIITRVPWSDSAKGFAYDSGISLLTYEEKLSKLIDFTSYLKTLINTFEKGHLSRPNDHPLGAYYVDLKARLISKDGKYTSHVVDDFVDEWLNKKDTRTQLVILGEYGTGKSSFCQKLAHDMALKYLHDPRSARIPVLLNLREFTKTLKIESMINSFLDEECGVINPKINLFRAMNDAGLFLLIFDGFDEMGVKVDSDTLEMNLQEIEKFASSPNCKLIVTSRLEFFTTQGEVQQSFHPQTDLFRMRETDYDEIELLLWSDPQVDEFLKKRVSLIHGLGHDWTYYRDRINEIEGLLDLSFRPAWLDLVVRTLPELISRGTPINRANLYETYLKGEIKRQKIIKRRSLLLTESVRYMLLQRLALELYMKKISSINFNDAMRHVEVIVQPPRIELESYTRDFLTCSFLIRKGDDYFFSHNPIVEYLIAKGLNNEISHNAPTIFGRKILQPVICDFLIDFNPDTNVLIEWLRLSKSQNKNEQRFLARNAATLLCRLNRNILSGMDLSGINLSGSDLSMADLRGVNFSGTDLSFAVLEKSLFLIDEISQAKVHSTRFSILFLGKFGSIDILRSLDMTQEHDEPNMIEIVHEYDGTISKLDSAEDEVPAESLEKALEYTAYAEIRDLLKTLGKKLQEDLEWGVLDVDCLVNNSHVFDSQGYVLGDLVVNVSSLRVLELVKGMVASWPWVRAVSLYADEAERFHESLPQSLRIEYRRYFESRESNFGRPVSYESGF